MARCTYCNGSSDTDLYSCENRHVLCGRHSHGPCPLPNCGAPVRSGLGHMGKAVGDVGTAGAKAAGAVFKTTGAAASATAGLLVPKSNPAIENASAQVSAAVMQSVVRDGGPAAGVAAFLGAMVAMAYAPWLVSRFVDSILTTIALSMLAMCVMLFLGMVVIGQLAVASKRRGWTTLPVTGLVLLAGYVLLHLYGFIGSEKAEAVAAVSKPQVTSKKPETSAAESLKLALQRGGQREFVTKMTEFKNRYHGAKNEIQEKAAVDEARAFEKQYFAATENVC